MIFEEWWSQNECKSAHSPQAIKELAREAFIAGQDSAHAEWHRFLGLETEEWESVSSDAE